MIVVTTARDLARVTASGGRLCSFVPTMGALHEGHASLVRQAAQVAKERSLSDGCVVSVFVNPTQFNDRADFDRYPRTLEADLALCEASGASIVYAPQPRDVYPDGESVAAPTVPAVATEPRLEDAYRPGHFAGVCQVVKRLFDIVRPQVAIFGEKDWQQFQVIRAMTQQLRYSIEVLSGVTVRERGGLAMSSRNRFLSDSERAQAVGISEALCQAWSERTPAEAEAAMRRVLAEHQITPEYAVVRDAASLTAPAGGAMRALIAARVGAVRLIDNVPWRPAGTADA
jgi:pantoate--beta-alanine ligase